MINNEPVCRFTTADTEKAKESIRLGQEIKRLTARKKAIDSELETKLRSNNALIAMYRGNTVAQMVPWSRSGLDVERIKAEQPDIAVLYIKDSSGMHIRYSVAV